MNHVMTPTDGEFLKLACDRNSDSDRLIVAGVAAGPALPLGETVESPLGETVASPPPPLLPDATSRHDATSRSDFFFDCVMFYFGGD